jgi:arylsulfatase A-like enzyme
MKSRINKLMRIKMTKPRPTSLSFLCIIILVLFCGCTTSNHENRPNIILILIDDLGWKDAGFMGSEYYETPNIDSLAAKGMIFTNAYVTAPNCAPSRASLLTGQYTPRHKIFTVNSSERGQSSRRKIIPIKNNTTLKLDKITIAESLKELGYKTASIGKWHLGKVPEYGPTYQGFDINIGGNHLGHPKSYFSPYQNDNLKDVTDGEYLTDRLTEESIRFIESNKNNNFFLYLSHYGVHTPIQAKKDLVDKYSQKGKSIFHGNPVYAAMIESIDESVGRILYKIDQLKLSERTLIFFLSDNGGFGKVTSMHPLRGSKGMLYEGGIKIPMIISWEGRIEAGSVCRENVICIDIFPTITDILGMGVPGQKIDGVSLSPLLYGKNEINRKAIFWHFPAYLEGEYTGSRDGYFRTRPAGAVKFGNWKLIQYFENNDYELYNLEDDAGETINLIDKNKEKAEILKNMLHDWQQNINAPIPYLPNPEYKSN